MSKETILYFNSKAAPYNEDWGNSLPYNILNLLDEHIEHGTIKNGKILDYCSGPGGVASHFLKKSWKVHCVDAAPNMLLKCAEKGVEKNNLHLVDLETEGLSFNDYKFDVVTCFSSLIYLKNACDIVGKMIEQAKQGGTIAFNIPLHQEKENTIIMLNNEEGYVYSTTSIFKEIIKNGGEPKLFQELPPIKGLPSTSQHILVILEKKNNPVSRKPRSL